MSTVTTSYTEHYASIFDFRSKKFIFNISISGGRTGERDVNGKYAVSLTVLRPYLFFSPINFSLISLFLEVVQVKGRCQSYQRNGLNNMRKFLFFCPKTFSSISIFLKFVNMKGKCQRYQRRALNSMRTFSFF